MMHMLLGVDATSIGKAPYASMFVRAKDIKAKEIGIQAAEGAIEDVEITEEGICQVEVK